MGRGSPFSGAVLLRLCGGQGTPSQRFSHHGKALGATVGFSCLRSHAVKTQAPVSILRGNSALLTRCVKQRPKEQCSAGVF